MWTVIRNLAKLKVFEQLPDHYSSDLHTSFHFYKTHNLCKLSSSFFCNRNVSFLQWWTQNFFIHALSSEQIASSPVPHICCLKFQSASKWCLNCHLLAGLPQTFGISTPSYLTFLKTSLPSSYHLLCITIIYLLCFGAGTSFEVLLVSVFLKTSWSTPQVNMCFVYREHLLRIYWRDVYFSLIGKLKFDSSFVVFLFFFFFLPCQKILKLLDLGIFI